MKRLTISVIFLVLLTAVCWGERERRNRQSKLKVIQLPQPQLNSSLSVEQALAKRRSVRDFTGQALNFIQLGQLAWAGQGITEPARGFRTAPSAGALYPIDLYFATAEGLFIYRPNNHSLEQILDVDIRKDLADAALGQYCVAQAPCDIIIAGSVKKLSQKYGQKAQRYMLIEAGHIAQNIQLQALSLDLGAVSIGAFEINNVQKVCKLSKTDEPIYITCVGYPAAPTEIREEKTMPPAAPAVKPIAPSEITENKIVPPTVPIVKPAIPKAALIIASVNFRDEELFDTKRVLEQARIETVVASSKTGSIKGMLGGTAQATMLINQLNVDDYDALVFVGGLGATEYFNNPDILRMVQQARQKNKVLAAICIAPVILANAGVLNGTAVTAFSSEPVVNDIKKGGAKFTGNTVERDGLIITANGPAAAANFGQAIVTAIRENKK